MKTVVKKSTYLELWCTDEELLLLPLSSLEREHIDEQAFGLTAGGVKSEVQRHKCCTYLLDILSAAAVLRCGGLAFNIFSAFGSTLLFGRLRLPIWRSLGHLALSRVLLNACSVLLLRHVKTKNKAVRPQDRSPPVFCEPAAGTVYFQVGAHKHPLDFGTTELHRLFSEDTVAVAKTSDS